VDDRLTRGGPLALRPAAWALSAGLQSDPRRAASMAVSAFTQRDRAGGYLHTASLTAEVRPAANLSIQLGPGVEGRLDPAQYVTTVADSLAVDTYGRRYVFAGLRRVTAYAVARADWTFAPTLSLQLYAQPFVSTGRFDGYKELARPGTFRFTAYGRDAGTLERDATTRRYRADPDGSAGPARPFTFADPAFSFRSVRSNAVLRWEYRPGSTLFLVWQQTRGSTGADGAFALGRDVGALLDAPAENVLLVKATYWLGR
jgi:hypothetical protein